MWYEIKNHTTNVELETFIVMPNHVHGILVLNGNNTGTTGTTVETTHALSLQSGQSGQSNETIGKKRYQNQGKNTISSIIGSYKSAVTKHAHRLGYAFVWQSRFYVHIIRDNQSYHQISNYIITTPATWQNDKFYLK